MGKLKGSRGEYFSKKGNTLFKEVVCMSIEVIQESESTLTVEFDNVKGHEGKLIKVKETRVLNRELLKELSIELDARINEDIIHLTHDINTRYGFGPTDFAPYYYCWQVGING